MTHAGVPSASHWWKSSFCGINWEVAVVDLLRTALRLKIKKKIKTKTLNFDFLTTFFISCILCVVCDVAESHGSCRGLCSFFSHVQSLESKARCSYLLYEVPSLFKSKKSKVQKMNPEDDNLQRRTPTDRQTINLWVLSSFKWDSAQAWWHLSVFSVQYSVTGPVIWKGG